MEKKRENIDDSIIQNLQKETIETTPEDGFVRSKEIRPTKMQHYGKGNKRYHKGYAKTVSFTTDDPRITRSFAYGLFGLFLVIGIGMLLFGNWIFGISFTSIALFGLVKSKKDIDRIAAEKAKQGQDVTVDSPQEREALVNEIKELSKAGLEEATASTFTKENYNSMSRKVMPVYYIIAAVITVLLCVFVNVILGLVIGVICCAVGFLFHKLISILFK